MGRPKGSRNSKGTKRIVMASGYVRVFRRDHPLAMRDGYVLEHRLVAYEAGWEVPPGHHVHHRNGDKADNRLENLEVIAEAEHHRQHVQEAGEVTNQFGTYPIAQSEAERKWRNRQKVARYNARRRQSGPPCAICGSPCARDKRTCSRACGYAYRAQRTLA